MIKLLIGLLLIGLNCSGQVEKVNGNRFEINQILNSGKKFYIQDSSMYSHEFIRELRTLDETYDFVKLINDNLIINKSDTIPIPVEFPLNKLITFQTENEKNKYCLNLRQINYTTIEYDFKVNDSTIKVGKVILPASFFLAGELSEDEEGNAVFVTIYFDKSNCWTSLIINDNKNKVDFEILCENDSVKNFKNLPTFMRK